MDHLELEILQRFDESRNAYNKATALLKKGQTQEADNLLRQALALYPREVFMDEDVRIDASIRESFDLLFSNIRERLRLIESQESAAPRLDRQTIRNLQELIERNQQRQQSGEPRLMRPGTRQSAGDSATLDTLGLTLPPPPPRRDPSSSTMSTIRPLISVPRRAAIAALAEASSAIST